jgi:hypothetical protein
MRIGLAGYASAAGVIGAYAINSDKQQLDAFFNNNRWIDMVSESIIPCRPRQADFALRAALSYAPCRQFTAAR